nr:hypothetical protein [Candidatus Sigynarchaeota archaeon]
MQNLDSFETFSRKHRKYHPFILKKVLAFYKAHPEAFHGLFKTQEELVLFFNAIKNAKVIVLDRDKIASGRRDPAKRKNPCVDYYRFFPAKFARFFQDRRGMIDFLKTILVQERDRARKRESYLKTMPASERKTGDTPCFMLANHPVWARGVLNKPGRHVGNIFDLTTIEGFVFFIHEAVHIMQWYRSPLTLIFRYIDAVVKSLALSEGHITWAHELIDFEVEAIVIHEKLWLFLESWPGTAEYLDEFKKYQ